ncbi:hypothetical protein [Ignavibacterium album]|nr:hypothetical protein [Ignavibacterium album]
MKLNFLMNIKVFDSRSEVGNQKVVWRIVPENSLESDVLDFTDRFLKLNIHEIKNSLITVLNSEYIFSSNHLRNLFSDKNNLTEILLNYLDEKGGIRSVQLIVSALEKLSETTKIPSKFSGVTLSQKKLSEFLKEKSDF